MNDRPLSDRTYSASGHDLTRLSEARVAELSQGLDPVQRHVACDAGTERAFTGTLWNEKAPGTYLCIICGLPLFVSDAKFDSGTGWPSFFQPYDPAHVRETTDHSYGMVRTETTCARCNGHLGHVFPDGPPPTGRRFCINSASLRFVPREKELPPEARPVR